MARAPWIVGLAIGLSPLVASPQAPPEPGLPDAGLFVRDTLRVETVVCPFKDSIEYETGEIECGLLQVPENRERPDSRFIEIHFVKLNARPDDEDWKVESKLEPGRRDDPVVYFTGGPGVRVDYYVERFKDHHILQHRDLYILEQRGIGSSADFCGFYSTRKPELSNAASFEDYLEAQLGAMADCARNASAAGVDLGGYDTLENARDVKALRMALGFESWNVWGISYGTMLGQAYLKEDPEGIRAVVLDANMPLDVRTYPWVWTVVGSYVRDLEILDELCQAQPDCAASFPDLLGRIRQAALGVRDAPLTVDVEDVERFPSGKASLFSDVVAFLPFMLLYDEENYPALPAVIHAWADAVERRDDVMVKALVLAGAGSEPGSSEGMSNAVLCQDGDFEAMVVAGRRDLEEYPVLSESWTTAENLERMAEICHDIGMPPRDPADYAMATTDLPVLVVEGRMDPITPPSHAETLLPGFAHGSYVEFPYAGHGPSRSLDCAGDMLNAFFDDPMEEIDTSCADEMEVPEFIGPLFATTAVPRVLVRIAEEPKSLIAPGVWGASSILVLLGGFVILTLAPLGRWIDRRRAVPSQGARVAAWTSALLASVSFGLFAAAFASSYSVTEVLLLLGLVSWARYAAVAGLLAGVAGIATVVLTLRAQRHERLPIGTLLGFLLTGIAAISLSVFLTVWDLGPF